MRQFIALFFVASCASSLVQATTIDFEEFASDSSGFGSVTTQGYTLTSAGTGLQPPDYAFFDRDGASYAWCLFQPLSDYLVRHWQVWGGCGKRPFLQPARGMLLI